VIVVPYAGVSASLAVRVVVSFVYVVFHAQKYTATRAAGLGA
jgi:hypothetical protein